MRFVSKKNFKSLSVDLHFISLFFKNLRPDFSREKGEEAWDVNFFSKEIRSKLRRGGARPEHRRPTSFPLLRQPSLGERRELLSLPLCVVVF